MKIDLEGWAPGQERPPRVFARTNLATVDACVPELVLGLVYRGFPTTLFGPTGAAKTAIAQRLLLDALRVGLRVAHWDAEMGAQTIAARYLQLGATEGELARIPFYDDQAPMLDESDAFLEQVREDAPDIILLDPTADFLAAAGVNENANDEVTAWAARFTQRLTHEGIATIVVDGQPHGGGHQRGASQKGYKAALVFELAVLHEPTRDDTGLVKLTCTKDRFAEVGKGSEILFAVGGDGTGRLVVERRESVRGVPQAERAAEERSEWLGYVVAVLRTHAMGEDHAVTQNQLEGLLPAGKSASFRRDAIREATSSATHPVHVKPGFNRSLLYWHDSGASGASDVPPTHPDTQRDGHTLSSVSGASGPIGTHPPDAPAGRTRDVLPNGVEALYDTGPNWDLLSRDGTIDGKPS